MGPEDSGSHLISTCGNSPSPPPQLQPPASLHPTPTPAIETVFSDDKSNSQGGGGKGGEGQRLESLTGEGHVVTGIAHQDPAWGVRDLCTQPGGFRPQGTRRLGPIQTQLSLCGTTHVLAVWAPPRAQERAQLHRPRGQRPETTPVPGAGTGGLGSEEKAQPTAPLLLIPFVRRPGR